MGPRNQVFDPNLLWAGLLVFGLVTAILLGVAVIQLLRRVYLEPDENSADLVEAIREAHLAGTLDDGEFRRVMEVLERPAESPIKIPAPVDGDPSEQF